MADRQRLAVGGDAAQRGGHGGPVVEPAEGGVGAPGLCADQRRVGVVDAHGHVMHRLCRTQAIIGEEDTPTQGEDTPTQIEDTPTQGEATPTSAEDTPTLGEDTPTQERTRPNREGPIPHRQRTRPHMKRTRPHRDRSRPHREGTRPHRRTRLHV